MENYLRTRVRLKKSTMSTRKYTTLIFIFQCKCNHGLQELRNKKFPAKTCAISSDNFGMETKELIDLCISVVKDNRVIGIAIVTIFFISLGNYVVHYKKHPRVVRRKVRVEKKPEPKKEEKNEEPAEE